MVAGTSATGVLLAYGASASPVCRLHGIDPIAVIFLWGGEEAVKIHLKQILVLRRNILGRKFCEGFDLG